MAAGWPIRTASTAVRLRGDRQPIDQRAGGAGAAVISARTAGLLTWMLKAVVDEGTGRRASLHGWEVAGKTGTTQAARDAWFIGFTADYVVGVWMGYDDNRPLTGVTGGGLPADIWHEVMTRLHEGRVPRPLNIVEPDPPAIVQAPAAPPRASTGTVVEQVFHDVLRGLGVADFGVGQRLETAGRRRPLTAPDPFDADLFDADPFDARACPQFAGMFCCCARSSSSRRRYNTAKSTFSIISGG